MATSQEIAQQIADQNSWFLQQNALASQIGMDPMAYRTGGGYFGGGVPVMPQHPGMTGSPGAFNYGIQGGAYGFGNAAARYGTAAFGMAPILGTGAFEAISGRMGMSSPLTNPFAAWGMARGMGLGIGGSALMTAGLMAPVAAMGAVANNMVTGARQQSYVNTAMGNYNFANPSSMTGFGFSRQDMSAVASKIRQLGMLPELLTSFDEITRLLPMMKSSGVMTGVRDAHEFGQRMKETIHTLRDVSKILGTTMEEAGEFFVHSRRVGFLGRQSQLQNTMNAQLTMSSSGMNAQQYMAMQETGAAFGQAIGGSRRLGAEAVSRFASTIGLAARNDPRLIETLTNMTGKTDPGAAAADAAVQMANLGVRVAGTGPGRYMLAGLMKVGENGEVGIDQGLMEQYLSGGISTAHLGQRGRQLMGNRKNVIAFERHQTKLQQQFASQGGPQAMLGLLQGALGTDSEAAALILQQQFGATEEQADLVKAMYDQGLAGLEEERHNMMQSVARNAARRERSPAALWARMKTKFRNTFLEGARELGANMHERVGRYFDEVYEDFFDDAVVRVSESKRKEFVQAIAQGDMGGGLKVDMAAYTGIQTDTSLMAGFRRSPLGSALAGAFTDTTTGRTLEETRSVYSRRIFGKDDASQGDINTALSGLQSGKSPEVRNASPEQRALGALWGNTRRELMRDSTFRDSSPAQQVERIRAEVEKRAEGSARGGLIRGEGMDPLLIAQAVANQMPENAYNQTSFDLNPPQKFDAQELRDKQRSVTARFKKMFGGEVGQMMQADPALRAAYGKSEAALATGENEDLLRQASLGNKDALAKFNKLTNQGLTQAQAAKVMEAYDARRKERPKHADMFGSSAGSFSDAASELEAVESASAHVALGGEARNVAEGIDIDKADKRISRQMGTYKAALELYGENPSKGFDEVASAYSGAIDAIEGIKNEKERGEALQTADPSIKRGYLQRQKSRERVTGLVKGGGGKTTVAQLAKSLNLDHATVQKILNMGGVDEKGKLTEDYGEKTVGRVSAEVGRELEKASERRTASGGVAAGAAENRQRERDSAQMTFFKIMTEALMSIAKSQDSDFKLSQGSEEAYTRARAFTNVPGR